MPDSSQLPLYKAAVSNVRAIERGIALFRKDLNKRLCLNSESELHLYTKIYVTLFCIWAEAILLRMIYVPHGFSANEIENVLTQNSVEEKWRTCLELSFKNSSGDGQKSLKQILAPRLDKLVSQYIATPALLRNKIAHGQWEKAFNASGTGINPNTTDLLALVDFIEVDRWFFVFGELAQLIENGVESPDRAFRRDAFTILARIEAELDRRRGWSLASKRALLSKRHRHN